MIHIFFLLVSVATGVPVSAGVSRETYVDKAACEKALPNRVSSANEVLKGSDGTITIGFAKCATEEEMGQKDSSI